MWTLKFQMFKLVLEKARGTRHQIANICWIMEKAREFQKNIYFCLINYAKAFDCVDHKKLWKILKEIGISEHLTCLLRNLYAGQEATVRTGHGTTISNSNLCCSRVNLYSSHQFLSITSFNSCLGHYLGAWPGKISLTSVIISSSIKWK